MNTHMLAGRRVRGLASHLAVSDTIGKDLATGSLPAEDLFGGAGFTDAVGVKTKTRKARKTRRMELMKLIDEMGLQENVKQLDEEGWTVIPDAMSPELTKCLRERIMDICKSQLDKKRKSGVKFAQLGSLLYHGRVFEEACQCPKQMLLAEYLIGANYNVWQYLCSVRGTNTGGLPVHNDLGGGFREPFHVMPEMATSLLICDDFNESSGGTFVVPGTHKLRRRPSLESAEDRALVQSRAVAIKCAAGSIAMWDGRLWHGSLPRRLPGERVVCSYAATRVHYRPGDDYSQLPAHVIERNPPRFRTMLGLDTGYQMLGDKGGVLFGGARQHNTIVKLAREEEDLPEMDPVFRMQPGR